MNRDGYRAGRLTAEHEAAHAVIAVLSGLAVGRVSIAPPKAHRRLRDGSVQAGRKVVSHRKGREVILAPITDTAHLDVDVAGYAWEVHAGANPDDALKGADWDLRNHLYRTDGEVTVFEAVEAFADAAERVREWLEQAPVAMAVHEVADRLMAGKSGEIWGTTVEQICARRGLHPYTPERAGEQVAR